MVRNDDRRTEEAPRAALPNAESAAINGNGAGRPVLAFHRVLSARWSALTTRPSCPASPAAVRAR